MKFFLFTALLLAAVSADLFCPSANDLVGMGSPQLFDGGWTHRGSGGVATKASFNLIGGSVEYDIDFTNTHTGINANIYTVSPYFSGSFSQNAYCDAQKSGDAWCVEVDWIESNGNCGGQSTLHTRPGTGNDGCTAWGCQSGYHYNGRPSFHMKITYDSNGVWTTIRDGQTISPSSLSPTPQAQDWQTLKDQYTQRGAVIYSSLWQGWVPLSDCGNNGDLGSSSFTVSNLRIQGTLVQGPRPTLCAGSQPSNPTPDNPLPLPLPPPSTPPASSNGINWNNNGNWAWATGCDFQGNDMGSVQVQGSDCGGRCQATDGCTHIAWTPPNNCWLKQGAVSASDAIASGTDGIVCGLTLSASNPPPATPVTPATPTPAAGSCGGVSSAYDPNEQYWVEVNAPQNVNLYVVCSNGGNNLYLSCSFAFGIKWQCATNGQACQPDAQSARYAVINDQWCRLNQYVPRAVAEGDSTAVVSQDSTSVPSGMPQWTIFVIVVLAILIVVLLVLIVMLSLHLRRL